MNLYDVIIVGGGPAGLNAAVVLGRSRRKVILFDTGNQRNRFSHGIHNYLTRDGMLPSDFISTARKEAKKVGVTLKKTKIIYAWNNDDNFSVKDHLGAMYYGKKLLIATGLTDKLPLVKGIDKFYGKSVFHCPYCDGWEVRDKKIGIYAKNKNGFDLALALTTWSPFVTYFTDGKKYMPAREAAALKKYKIPVITDRIRELEGNDGQLKKIVLTNNTKINCDALFFVNGYMLQSPLVESLGCRLTHKKAVITNRFQQTNIHGVYVAGDAAKDMHFVVVAAAEGAKAGVIINKELQHEERAAIIR